MFSIFDLVDALNNDQVIIYPTESVLGLGCDPDSLKAVRLLLTIKRRSWKKGLILVAAEYQQLVKYIDDSLLTDEQRDFMFSSWPGPFTWIIPAKVKTPYWLTGCFSSIAVRLSSFEPIRLLCLAFGKPLVSTSANISGYPPAFTIKDVYDQFGSKFVFMNISVEGRPRPSNILDVFSRKIIR